VSKSKEQKTQGQFDKPLYKRNLSKNYGIVMNTKNMAAEIQHGLNHSDDRYHGTVKRTLADGTVEYIDPITRAKIE